MTTRLDKLLESGCETDAGHKLCRSRGGESCAFDGAAIVLMPIADAAHVVHGPISCAGNAWEGRGVHSSAGDMHRRGFTTDIGELDIVYGGESKLDATVREVVALESPAAVFVYSTCVTGLNGEDIDAVCSRLASELALPVVPVHSPGFVGPKNLGNRIAGDALLEHVIGTGEPVCTTPTDIVLIGEYNVAGDLDLVEPLLAEAGIRVLSHITGNARFEEIAWAHRAKAAAVVCSRALINVATGLRRGWGMPHVEVSFFGATEIARSLRAISELLEAVSPDAVGVGERVEQVIARHELQLAKELAPYRAVLEGKRAFLYSGGVKSWSMASALADLGIEVVGVGTKKSSHEDEVKTREILGDAVPLIEDVSAGVVRRFFAEGQADLLVAGGRNRYLAAKEGWPFIDVNQEREHAYAGYDGLVNIARDLAHSVRFYEYHARLDADCAPEALIPQPAFRREERSASIDPLKNAPSLGACVALQGIHRAMPVLHSAQGCAFLGKVLAIRHFNEPIALATSKLFTEDVVMGSTEAIEEVVRTQASLVRADLVAVVSGGLAEVKGDDVDASASALRGQLACEVVAVHAPDYKGGFEEGFAAAVEELVGLAPERPTTADGQRAGVDTHQLTVLAGSQLSPGDALELRTIVESFGLFPIIVPDLGALDGSRNTFSPLAEGGTTVPELLTLARSAHTLVLGPSLEPAARKLARRHGPPYTVLDASIGLQATDRLVATLALLTGEPTPPRLERERRMLLDALRDVHVDLAGTRIALALEPDHALSMAAALRELAIEPVVAVVPTETTAVRRLAAGDVVVGDLGSLPESGLDLIISNSHARRRAGIGGIPLLETGFPVFAAYGASRVTHLGYRGATALVDTIANLLASHVASPTTGARA